MGASESFLRGDDLKALHAVNNKMTSLGFTCIVQYKNINSKNITIDFYYYYVYIYEDF